MLRARLAEHPRHLIPARSRFSRPEQIALFVANVEKEYGTVTRVTDIDATPAAVADYLASQKSSRRRSSPRRILTCRPFRGRAAVAACAGGPRGADRYGEPATRLCRDRRDGDADATVRAGAADHA